jgi:hypothetical protein
LTGNIPDNVGDERQKAALEEMLRLFTIPARLAKEVYERGDFVNIITSDAVSHQDRIGFVNRIRRIDGEEFSFMSDPESTIHLLQHFVGRLTEIEKSPQGKKALLPYYKELTLLAERLKALQG